MALAFLGFHFSSETDELSSSGRMCHLLRLTRSSVRISNHEHDTQSCRSVFAMIKVFGCWLLIRPNTMPLLETRLAALRTVLGPFDIVATIQSRRDICHLRKVSFNRTKLRRGPLEQRGTYFSGLVCSPSLQRQFAFRAPASIYEPKSLELLDALWRLFTIVIEDVRPVLIAS